MVRWGENELILQHGEERHAIFQTRVITWYSNALAFTYQCETLLKARATVIPKVRFLES